ncbi:MAG: hypothetical protein Ct9H300mP20_16900 [Gammaproteobacteria bacterium]|nr:MAG: hypothetical protein Ct9H300mP20_16900 [Gammaproteobacteria bacterium]
MNHRGLRDQVVVLGKGAHTPDCYPHLIRPQLEEPLDRLKMTIWTFIVSSR